MGGDTILRSAAWTSLKEGMAMLDVDALLAGSLSLRWFIFPYTPCFLLKMEGGGGEGRRSLMFDSVCGVELRWVLGERGPPCTLKNEINIPALPTCFLWASR